MAGVEVAFAGRSNVGKSSLINVLTGDALAWSLAERWADPRPNLLEGPEMPVSDSSHARLRLRLGAKRKLTSWTGADPQTPAGRRQSGAGPRRRLRRPARPQGGRSRRADTLDKSAVAATRLAATKADQVKRPNSSSASLTSRPALQSIRRRFPNLGDLVVHRRRHAGIARRHGAPARRAELTDASPPDPHPDRAGRDHGRRRRDAGGGLRRISPMRRGWPRRRRCCCFMPWP